MIQHCRAPPDITWSPISRQEARGKIWGSQTQRGLGKITTDGLPYHSKRNQGTRGLHKVWQMTRSLGGRDWRRQTRFPNSANKPLPQNNQINLCRHTRHIKQVPLPAPPKRCGGKQGKVLPSLLYRGWRWPAQCGHGEHWHHLGISTKTRGLLCVGPARSKADKQLLWQQPQDILKPD